MTTAATIRELTAENVKAIADMQRAFVTHRTFGEKVADAVATSVGSWPFIVIQSVLLIIWMLLNLIAWSHHWDPYPFILLNLALSFQAAYASPIIMMSQNRQAKLESRRNQLDLQINLLAEQENTEMLRLLRLLCQQSGISVDGPVAALEEPTRPDDLIRQIETAEPDLGGVRSKRTDSEGPANRALG